MTVSDPLDTLPTAIPRDCDKRLPSSCPPVREVLGFPVVNLESDKCVGLCIWLVLEVVLRGSWIGTPRIFVGPEPLGAGVPPTWDGIELLCTGGCIDGLGLVVLALSFFSSLPQAV